MMFALLRNRHTFTRLLECTQAASNFSLVLKLLLFGVQAEVIALLNEEYGFEYMEDVDWEDVLRGDMQVGQAASSGFSCRCCSREGLQSWGWKVEDTANFAQAGGRSVRRPAAGCLLFFVDASSVCRGPRSMHDGPRCMSLGACMMVLGALMVPGACRMLTGGCAV